MFLSLSKNVKTTFADSIKEKHLNCENDTYPKTLIATYQDQFYLKAFHKQVFSWFLLPRISLLLSSLKFIVNLKLEYRNIWENKPQFLTNIMILQISYSWWLVRITNMLVVLMCVIWSVMLWPWLLYSRLTDIACLISLLSSPLI